MPREIKEVKEFLTTTRRKDARGVKVKKTNGVTKFKVRCSRFLYTFKVADAKKAEKIRASLPPSLKIEDIDAKKAAPKKK